MVEAEFPLRILSEGHADELVIDEIELVTALEWFDSERDPNDQSIRVVDALGRPVSVRAEALVVKRLEVKGT